MNRAELIGAIAANSGLSKKESETALDATVDALRSALIAGERIQLGGFGIFEVKVRTARTGRNPRTKEPLEIPEIKIPQFKPGRALKEAVAKS